MSAAILLLALVPLVDGNRLWWLDVELHGAHEGFTLDCGAAGETVVRGPFAEGRLSVPVPARSPLGAEGLGLLALPEVRATDGVRVLGWSERQPDAALARSARVLLQRGRPPLAAARARAGGPEVALTLVLLPCLFALRRRRGLFALVAVLGGLFLALRGARRAPEARTEELLDIDLAAGVALEVRAARATLALPRTRLEARPDEARLVFTYEPATRTGWVQASGVDLFALEPAVPPDLGLAANGGEPLALTWLRPPGGAWEGHGAWPSGEPLGPVARGTAPPGWLTGALPPGTVLLVARRAGGGWLRASGFVLPDEERPLGD